VQWIWVGRDNSQYPVKGLKLGELLGANFFTANMLLLMANSEKMYSSHQRYASVNSTFQPSWNGKMTNGVSAKMAMASLD